MPAATHDPTLSARIASVRPVRAARAGSALVWHGHRLLLIQDDALCAVWVDPDSGEATQWPLEGAGEALVKAEKPDFEAAFVGPGREVTILGSGSAPGRRRVARLHLDTGAVRIAEERALFDAVEAAIGMAPNLEGALLQGNTLMLFHRGAGREASAVVDVDMASIARGEPRVSAVRRYELGLAGGVPLHFTDATIVRGRIVYLAVAEDTPNAIDDGPIVGAAVGVFDGDSVRFAILEEPSGEASRRKLEGIAERPDRGTIYAVTDPDDPERSAELCTITLEGF
jgi:hypothetical protein